MSDRATPDVNHGRDELVDGEDFDVALAPKSPALSGRGAPWRSLEIPSDSDYYGPGFKSVVLTKESGLEYLDAAITHYREEFNEAGRNAGIRGEWSHNQTKALYNKRLVEPGVILLILNPREEIAGQMLVDLWPSLGGMRGTEFDILVSEPYRNREAMGMGMKIVAHGFNLLNNRSLELGLGPIIAIDGETYLKGYQRGLWKRKGFDFTDSLTSTIERQSPIVDGIHINRLTDENFFEHQRSSDLQYQTKEFLLSSRTVYSSGKTRLGAVAVTNYLDNISQYLFLKGPDEISTFYVASREEGGRPLAFQATKNTIRRHARVTLLFPWTAIDGRLDSEDQKRIRLALFQQAALDACEDARKHGARMWASTTQLEYGNNTKPAWYEEMTRQLDNGFINIVAQPPGGLQLVQERTMESVKVRSNIILRPAL